MYAVRKPHCFLLLRKVTHSDSFEWAKVIPLNGRGGDTFRPVVVSLPGSPSAGCSTLIGALNISTNSIILVSAAQRTGIAVGIRVILCEVFQLTDINFTHQRRNIWLFSSPGSVLAVYDLFQDRQPDFHHAEFGDVATKLVQAFCGFTAT